MAVHSDRDKTKDRCTCDANGAVNPTAHRATCVGRHKTGWRARLPEFLLPEVEAIENGTPRGLPIDVYRDLTMEYAHRARFGKAAANRPMAPEPVLIQVPARFYDGPEAHVPAQRQAQA